jgi:mitochondrial fission protein ELM1
VLGDGIGSHAQQTNNERQALALAAALLKSSSQSPGGPRNLGWNVQTASLAAIQHPMPRLFRPLSQAPSSQLTSGPVDTARRYLPSAVANIFSRQSVRGSAALPAPFNEPGDQSRTLVLASGPRVSLSALQARDQLPGSRVIHVQCPTAAEYRRFDAIVSPSFEVPPGSSIVENVITSSHSLHDITPGRLAAHAARQPADDILALPRPRLSMLLGGPRASRLRSVSDFWTYEGASRAAGQLASIVGPNGSVVMTVTQRTPDSFALRLQRELVAQLGTSRVMYDDGSLRSRYLFLLATSDALVVTADSAMMISEALASKGAPVALVGPPDSPQLERFTKSLAEAGSVVFLDDERCDAFRANLGRHVGSAEEDKDGGFLEVDRVASDVWKLLRR